MPTVPLPAEPSFEQLRKQAKDLQRAVRAEEPAALAEVAERYPGGLTTGPAGDAPLTTTPVSDAPAGDAPRPTARARDFPLTAAQLVVARRHGFTSWPRLKRHVETVERLSRNPARLDGCVPAAGLPDV